jgi:hypothetical protein
MRILPSLMPRRAPITAARTLAAIMATVGIAPAGDGMRRRVGESRGAARLDRNAEQPIIWRSWRLNERGRVKELPAARLLALYALARGAGPPRSPTRRKQRKVPWRAATRGRELPAQCGRERLQAPAPGRHRRPLSPGRGAAAASRHAEIQPVHALRRGAELARPERRFRGSPAFPTQCTRLQSPAGAFVADHSQGGRMPAPAARRARRDADWLAAS